MADFSHLKALDVSVERTAEYTIHQITVNGKSPTLILAPATDVNKSYFNARLKKAGKTARQVRAGNVDVGIIVEDRASDRELFPLHVAKGWRDMVDAKGTDVEFTAADCKDFFNALPDWVFDDVRNFAGNPVNFSESIDIEVHAKN